MSKIFTAIHVTKDDIELTADFEFSDADRKTVEHEEREKKEKKKLQDPIRIAADAAMMAKHGVNAHAWCVDPEHGSDYWTQRANDPVRLVA